ncbi:Phosphomethylpyrimidine synthase [Candidatus Burarchaeum australiense]|nr:Phosphomethylpyrimidine synthase [Candidatus Burarchaeum australiense]
MKSEFSGLARAERMRPDEFARRVNAGSIVVLKHRRKPAAACIGAGCTTKINTNLGISLASPLKLELEKLRVAEMHGSDTIMDLSTRDTVQTLRTIIAHSEVPVGSVPIYSCLGSTSEDDFINAVEEHVKAGASFVTVHAAVLREGVRHAKKRVTKIVSRGGGILAQYMHETGKENPLYENYDAILDLMRGTGCAMSLGDALRPGALADAHDKAQLHELKVQGELVKRARAAGVPVFCEGPGHMPLDLIAKNVRLKKRICRNAPYYVLGPLTTDCALGDDDVNSAIGGAIAAAAGVDFLCVVTPQEHYSLPTLEGVRDGVIAAKIAAHSGDVVKLPWTRERDLKMSKARYALDWTSQLKHSLTRRKVGSANGSPCSMCLKFCPMNLMRKIKS